MASPAELSALAVSIAREFGMLTIIAVLVVFAIVYKVFHRFFGD